MSANLCRRNGRSVLHIATTVRELCDFASLVITDMFGRNVYNNTIKSIYIKKMGNLYQPGNFLNSKLLSYTDTHNQQALRIHTLCSHKLGNQPKIKKEMQFNTKNMSLVK